MDGWMVGWMDGRIDKIKDNLHSRDPSQSIIINLKLLINIEEIVTLSQYLHYHNNNNFTEQIKTDQDLIHVSSVIKCLKFL